MILLVYFSIKIYVNENKSSLFKVIVCMIFVIYSYFKVYQMIKIKIKLIVRKIILIKN